MYNEREKTDTHRRKRSWLDWKRRGNAGNR